MLDDQMGETLRHAAQGIKVVRCEEGATAFSSPCSRRFDVLLDLAGGRRRRDRGDSIGGYTEPPAHGARVAGCGTHWQRAAGNCAVGQHARRASVSSGPLRSATQRQQTSVRTSWHRKRASWAEKGGRGALLYIDLAHFRRSTTHWAIGGDQVLSIVAQRLRACVKDGDTVARLGGDEFTADPAQRHRHHDGVHGGRSHHPVMQLPIRLARPIIACWPALASPCSQRTARNGRTGAQRRPSPCIARRNQDGARRSSTTPGWPNAARERSNTGLFRAVTRREFSLTSSRSIGSTMGGWREWRHCCAGRNRAVERWLSPAEFNSSRGGIRSHRRSGRLGHDTVCAQIAQ